MTAAQAKLEVLPTPKQIDAQATEYKRLEKIVDDVKAQLAEKREALDKLHATLIDLTRSFGDKHHEKSKILRGIQYELMATFGQSAGIDGTAVERLRLALKEANQTRLLKKLFTEQKSYRLAPNASEILKSEGKLTDDLATLALACFTFTPSTPRLEVRPRKK